MSGSIDTHDLDLRELMQPVQSAYVLAVATCLATETLRVGAVLDRQLFLVDDLVAVQVRHRYLSRRNQIQVIHLAVVHLTFFVRQLACAVTRSGIHYRRRHDLCVTGFVSLGEEEIDQRSLQTRTLTDINGEARAADLDTQVKINQVVFLR